MKTNEILMATLMQIYSTAILLARENNQIVGEKNDFYITLEQLEALLNQWKN